MSPESINTAIALKLHSFGLMQLHDPNWTGMEMFDRLKQHTRGRAAPTDLLRKTLRDGLLHHLGLWLYDDFLFSDTHRMSLGGEYRLWYLEDLLELLRSAGVPPKDDLVRAGRAAVEEIDALYTNNEREYWRAVDRDRIYTLTEKLIEGHEKELRAIAPRYARNYAERVFHDRQLCEHINKTLIMIGFDGTGHDGEEPKQWVDRLPRWPTWAVEAIIARDRGLCALCGVSISAELRAARQVDHIIPLSRGGTNDLSNLQLLCDKCNGDKRAALIDVKSSVPEYLRDVNKKRESRGRLARKQ